ncbi:MAG: CidA/LrgA family protein [Treponema sp.]|nr:CidA/LrgA family protein [Candidatus Treponema equifaecale]
MNIIRQFTILVVFCFIGEILHKIIPLPVPSAIYGMVLMFCALQFKLMPLSAVEKVSDYLLGIMPLLFVPSTVGLIVAWPILQKYGIQFVLIGILSTMLVFFVTGHVTQLVIRIQKKLSSQQKQSGIPSSRLERSGGPSSQQKQSGGPSSRLERSGSPSSRLKRSGMERSLDCARDDQASLRDDQAPLHDDQATVRDDNDVSNKNNSQEEK